MCGNACGLPYISVAGSTTVREPMFLDGQLLRKRKMKRIRDNTRNMNNMKTKRMQLAMTTTGMKVVRMIIVNLRLWMVLMMPRNKVNNATELHTGKMVQNELHLRYIQIVQTDLLTASYIHTHI
jgi:hypothetical protein